MKHKFKPIARAELRERVEAKFRARGAVAFHLLLVLLAGLPLLYRAPSSLGNSFDLMWLRDATLLYIAFVMSGALHFIRYHFRHGRGRERHEAETEAQAREEMRRGAVDDAEEQRELIRLRKADKLRNRRFVWQHLVVYAGVMGMLAVTALTARQPWHEGWEFWQPYANIAGIWGFGLAAHALRYYFSFGAATVARAERIEAEVEREMRRRVRRSGGERLSVGGAEAESMKLAELRDVPGGESRGAGDAARRSG